MPTDQELTAQVTKLCGELDKRARKVKLLDLYTEGGCPLPDAVIRAKVTKAYRLLMPMAEAPFGSLIVDSVQDRLIPTGLRSPDESVDKTLWGVWQDNQMDAEALLAHDSALTHGRAFALVWPAASGTLKGQPQISLDSAEQMIVSYREGSRTERTAALRRWVDDNRSYCTLYRPDGIYKFIGPKNSSGMAGTQWARRDVDGEEWPLRNPLGVVPVVEIPVNRKLKPGAFPWARGEFEHATGLLDRINTLVFLGLIVAFWQGFPIRVLIGDKILRDDEGNALPPFKAMAGDVAQFEDPETKIAQYDAADRKQLSVYQELDHLSAVTKTPRHYFPLEHGMSNLSADAIRATEGGLVAKIPKHKGSLGEAWEEVLRLSGLMLDSPVALSPRAEMQWADHENRSMAERADAAVKLKDILPWQFLAEHYLNVTQDEIGRLETMLSSSGLGALMSGLTTPGADPLSPAVDASAVKAKADAMGVLIRSGVSAESAAKQVGLDVDFTGAVPVSLRLPQSDAGSLEAA